MVRMEVASSCTSAEGGVMDVFLSITPALDYERDTKEARH